MLQKVIYFTPSLRGIQQISGETIGRTTRFLMRQIAVANVWKNFNYKGQSKTSGKLGFSTSLPIIHCLCKEHVVKHHNTIRFKEQVIAAFKNAITNFLKNVLRTPDNDDRENSRGEGWEEERGEGWEGERGEGE